MARATGRQGQESSTLNKVHKVQANAGSTVNFSLMNLKVLDLQSLQFVDTPFAYQAEDPTRQIVMDPNSKNPFVKLPGYCEGDGCQL